MRSLRFSTILDRLARWKFPANIDGVVGVATGGVVPAALVAQRLGVGLKIIALNYRDEANAPRHTAPRLLAPVPRLGRWRRVLLVDDVYVSGKSWHAARALLPAAVEVLPFVFKGRVAFALFPDVRGCVRWPWKVYPVPGLGSGETVEFRPEGPRAASLTGDQRRESSGLRALRA